MSSTERNMRAKAHTAESSILDADDETSKSLHSNIHYDNNEAVTIVYPPSLLSSNGELVNLVHIPNEVDGTLEGTNLPYNSNVVIQQDFETDSRIAVITGSAEGQLELSYPQSSETITYFQTSSDDASSRSAEDSHNLLSEHLIQIPTSDSDGNSHTVSVPLSVVNDSFLSSIKLPFGTENDISDSISLPVNLQTNNLVPISNAMSQSYIITDMPSADTSLEDSKQPNITTKVSKHKNKMSQRKALKHGQVGRPPKIQRNRKLIGFGPTAISAQGVVQEINNRKVTVLPRPEDLKKLMDNKQLNSYPMARYTQLKRKLQPMDKEVMDKGDLGQIVLDVSLSDIEKESAGAICGKIKQEDILKDFPPLASASPYARKAKATKKRRGKRGRPRKAVVLSYVGGRRGRPRKVQTVVEGPKGPCMIYTGPQNEHSTKAKETSDANETSLPSELQLDVDTYDTSEGVQDSNVGVSPHKEVTPPLEQQDQRRKLPPRNRGARYQKMIQVLKEEEDFDDDDFITTDDYSPDFSLKDTSNVPVKQNSSFGRGKRARISKEPPPFRLFESDGTKIIQLAENLKPLVTESCPSILIKEGREPQTVMEVTKELQHFHKGVITFERPETGERVLQHVASIQIDNDDGGDLSSHITVKQEDLSDEEGATIFIKEDGDFEKGFECFECKKILVYKQDFIQHAKAVHGINPLKCSQCNKPFTTRDALENHQATHCLEKAYRCNHCGADYATLAMLKAHVHYLEHECGDCGRHIPPEEGLKSHLYSAKRPPENYQCLECATVFRCKGLLEDHSCKEAKTFECDICHLQFISSSGLNRHRKVHSRTDAGAGAGPQEGVDKDWRCTTCWAIFSYKRSLLKHIQMSHGASVPVDADRDMEEKKAIHVLQRKLNEGYAPKTSELYDLPDEPDITDTPDKDPFLCGICNSSFIDIDVLCDHYSSCHTGEQNVYCNVCSVGCSNDDQLQKHSLIHLEEVKKTNPSSYNLSAPFACNFCPKTFKKEYELEKHLKTHTQGKPFKCHCCSAAFTIKSTLDKHILVHTGQRPFRCDICQKSFRQSAALIRHKLWTHRLKNQNKCDICAKTFFTKELLNYHLDSHGEEGERAKERLMTKADAERENAAAAAAVTEADPDKEDSFDMDEDPDTKKKICEYCGKECPSIVALLTHKLTHKLSGSYKCDVCHRTFREKRYLKKHKLTHKGLKVWGCDICTKTFATKLTLIRHAQVHLREALRPDISPLPGEEATPMPSSLPSVLKCERCNIDFSHKMHYVRHTLLHSGIPLLKCGHCDRMFVHKSDMIRHKVMHSFMFTCEVCGRNFHKKALFLIHKKKHYDDKPFKCEKCFKSFATIGNFNIHMRIHSGEKPYWCNLCDYRCSQSGRLAKHKRMHAGIKPYSCDVCQKQFVNQDSVKVHQRIHTGERPYRCGNCMKSFINSHSLNHHLRDHLREETFKCHVCHHKFRRQDHLDKHVQFHSLHKHYQENVALKIEPDTNIVTSCLFMCEVCGRVFDKKKYLYTHMNVHSKMRTYPCTFCSKNLGSRMALKNHLLIHSGEMPYKCCFCEKEFRSLCNLKRHEKVHSQEDIHPCDDCGETFYSRETLAEHRQEHLNFMMMNTEEMDSVSDAVNEQLYVFHTIVENEQQQQFLVDSSQSLLSFPETSTENFTAEIPEPPPPLPPPPVHDEGSNIQKDSPFEQIQSDDIEPVPDVSIPEVLVKGGNSVFEERTVEKPHQCDVCFKTFAKKQYLTKHKYRHREVKPHPCDVCGKRFAQKFEVAVHKLKHTGEKPYQCDICLKEFRSKMNLVNHRMRHTGEYPYLCSVCNKGLSTQIQLEKHVSIHTGALPFKCDYCTRAYSQRSSLERHLIKTHNAQLYNKVSSSKRFDQKCLIDPLETIQAISNMPNLEDEGPEEELVTPLIRKTEDKDDVDMDTSMDIASMDRDLEVAFAIPVQPGYLKTCLLEASHEDAKFLDTILQHSRNDENEESLANDHDVC